jgi:hypothetical protein
MWMITTDNATDVVMNKQGELRTSEGLFIASIYEDADGVLQISLDMNTNFKYEDFSHAGWTGDENHMISSVWLKRGGGTLNYKYDRYTQNDGKKIIINILQINGVPVPKKIPRGAKKFWKKLFN